eukprot:TRINITY_DN1755_c0_g1_i4.p1 TRINITY_DN1755_c0_g1~~TRINITY_DN1755_c0_g1_i4.p1  ORF type:complete len:574 (+),score=75.31 TRINITY_DN1755_c0_g1_i4:78-1799(+)
MKPMSTQVVAKIPRSCLPQAVLLVALLCCRFAEVSAMKANSGKEHADDMHHHVAALTSITKKGHRMSYNQLRGMEDAVVKMVMKKKASPGTNKAVLQILNMTENIMRPAVERRAEQARQDLRAAKMGFTVCTNNTAAALAEPDRQRDRLAGLKAALESCVWGVYDFLYPASTHANNPSIGRSASISSGTKLGNVTYASLSCGSGANPYLCPAAPQCGWPSNYDGSYLPGVYGGGGSVTLGPTTTTTTHICDDTLTKCNAARTACQDWENKHYMNNQRDQINDNESPTSKECDRRDFQSVGQYLLAMKTYWKNARTQAPWGWEPMKCFCDQQLATCQAAQQSCPHEGSRIPSVGFYNARWIGKVNWTCVSNYTTSYVPTTAAGTTTTGTTGTGTVTTTSTTTGNFCHGVQTEMDHVACNQTNGRINACRPFASCYGMANSTFNATWQRICSYPNGDKYGVRNEYYGLLRMECVLKALFSNFGTPAIMAAVKVCVNKTIEDYESNLTVVAITECDHTWPGCSVPAGCEPVLNVSSYRDSSGTAEYRGYYYKNLQCPAPCLSSCCVAQPNGVTGAC